MTNKKMTIKKIPIKQMTTQEYDDKKDDDKDDKDVHQFNNKRRRYVKVSTCVNSLGLKGTYKTLPFDTMTSMLLCIKHFCSTSSKRTSILRLAFTFPSLSLLSLLFSSTSP